MRTEEAVGRSKLFGGCLGTLLVVAGCILGAFAIATLDLAYKEQIYGEGPGNFTLPGLLGIAAAVCLPAGLILIWRRIIHSPWREALVKWGIALPIACFGLLWLRSAGLRLIAPSLIGVGIMLVALGFAVAGAVDAKRRKLPPWLRRADWAAGRIIYSPWREVLGYWGGGLALGCFGLILFWLVFGLGEDDFGLLAFGLLMMFLALSCAVAGALAARRSLRSGTWIFEMPRVPSVVGGRLEGTVRIPRALPPETRFEVRLGCERTDETTGDIWQRWKHAVQGQSAADNRAHTTVPVSFEIPPHVKPTRGGLLNRPMIRWKLHVNAVKPFAAYRATFTVPVFATDETASTPQSAEAWDHP